MQIPWFLPQPPASWFFCDSCGDHKEILSIDISRVSLDLYWYNWDQIIPKGLLVSVSESCNRKALNNVKGIFVDVSIFAGILVLATLQIESEMTYLLLGCKFSNQKKKNPENKWIFRQTGKKIKTNAQTVFDEHYAKQCKAYL